tara:strand:- start:3260 stop:4180 length:921 start_codon:yes stop_codon:yes gene_type:complete
MQPVENYKESLITNDQINILETISILYSELKLIILITSVFALSSIAYSLSLPNLYTSSSVLRLTEDSTNTMSSLTNQYGGIASMAGISLPGAANDESFYIISTLKSKDFLKKILEFPEIKQKLAAVETYDHSTKKFQYKNRIYDDNTKKWNQNISYLTIHESLKGKFKVSQDPKSKFINLSFEHISPEFSYEFLSLLIQQINKITREKDAEKSINSINYLKNQLDKTDQSDIRQSINQLIEMQLKTLMLANIEEDYLFSTIDPPFIPLTKSSPTRALICILISLLGGLISTLIVLIKHHLKPHKPL